MTTADIWQIVIGIISILASISLSLIIFYYQIKTDKKVKKQEIDNKTTNFIIENKEEISLLPLCIISNALHKTDKHSHRIYTAFNKLDKDTQKNILKQEDISFDFKISPQIVNDVISHFQIMEEVHNLGKSMLYDSAKYFHRSYELYKNDKIEVMDPHVFKTPYPTFLPEHSTNLHTYISNYILHRTNPNDDLLIKVREQYFVPPMDLLYNEFDLGNCEEKILCFWLMRYIISACYVFNNRNLVKPMAVKIPILEEFTLNTYEDMYYYTIYILIKTFSVK